jgi:hypothetical protein
MTRNCSGSHRTRTFLRVSSLLIALVAAPSLAQSPPPSPCSSPEHRQFDFWLCEWEVRGPAGKVAGTNRITRAFGDCVLHEQYETGRGYSGSTD